MSQDYSPSLVTKSLVFCGDAAMKSAAGPATLLYDKVNDNNGTMYNGTVVQLDGGDEYLDCGVIDYSSYTGLSVCAWINGPGLSAAQTFVSNWGPSGTSDFAWLLFISQWVYNTPDFLVSTNGTGYSRLAATSTLASGQWHHLVGTWESGSMKLYLNGVLDASGSGPASIYNPAYKTAVGADFDGGTPRRPFDGMMADVRVYDKVLSLANVKEIYDDSKVIIPTKNDGSGGFIGQSNLKIWLPLMEGAGTIGYDGSGNGNNGIGTNFDAGSGANADWLTGQTGCPQLITGYNRPMSFDGSDDWVDCGSSPITSNSAFSWAAWINPTGSSGTPFFLGTNVAGEAMVSYWDSSTGMVRLGVWGADRLYSTIAIPVNSWGHTCWTWDGTTLRAYTNGVAAGTATPAAFNIASNDMIIGAASASAQEFEGLINEVIVYDTALTLAQVQALAATDPNGGPLPPDPMSLSNSSDVVAYLRNDGNVTWTDRSGNGNTGTVNGSPDALLFKQGINGSASTSTGRDGQGFPLKQKNVGAIGFNGSDDQITFGSFTAPDGEANLTISAWVKAGSVSSSHHRIFSKEAIIYVGRVAGNLSMYVGNGSVWTESSASLGSVTAGEWMHVVYIKDGTTGRTYINGANTGLTFTTLATLGTNAVTAYIGSSSTVQYWDGQIADVQIYNRALTYAEIQQNYNSFKARFGK